MNVGYIPSSGTSTTGGGTTGSALKGSNNLGSCNSLKSQEQSNNTNKIGSSNKNKKGMNTTPAAHANVKNSGGRLKEKADGRVTPVRDLEVRSNTLLYDVMICK